MLAYGTEGADSKHKPLVSVVIPTHNRANLLQEALDSVYLQEGIGEQFDMEVIVVDDASSDTTPEISYKYPTIKYIQLLINSGPASARNVGIRASRGKYVAFLDDDDKWFLHRLRVQVPVLEANPEIGVVYGHGVVTDEEGGTATWPETGPSGRVFEDFLTRTEDFINIDTLLVRRDAFEKAGYFDESIATMEHYEMALRLAFHYPWRFVSGHVAYGRFSKRGKWFSDVINGYNELTIVSIIEKALKRLPNTPEYEEVKRNARVAVCVTVAAQRWWVGGGVEAVRAHLLSSLRMNPWMVEAPPVNEHLYRVVRELACTSSSHIATVRAFWKEIKAVLSRPGFKEWLKMRRLLTVFLAEAAIALQKDGSPRRAAYVAACAIFRDPTQLKRKVLWSLVYSLFRRLVGGIETHELWPKLLGELSESTSDVFFVEIGAMDGISFDPLYEYVARNDWRGLVVEPLPDLFEQLKKTYRAHTNVIVENIAIADTPGKRAMYRVMPEAVRKGAVPSWAKGIASFFGDRNALGGKRISREDFEKIRPHIVSQTVMCETLGNLLRKHNISKIDVFQVDVEGYDYHVLKQLDFDRFRPRVIRIEWYNLPHDEKKLGLELLKRHGYRTITCGEDLLAWSK